MSLLVLIRHGQSLWNLKNLFTGWVDVPLSPKGVEEALAAGQELKDTPIDVIYTTPLSRACTTAMLIMSQHSSDKTPIVLHSGEGKMEEWGKYYYEDLNWIPVYKAWQLNERMYGELQGLNKALAAEKYGNEQVHIWRRSYATPPPNGESLKMTGERTIPYFEKTIVPEIQSGKNVLVSAHGNSLRSIIMDIEGLSEEEVVNLELKTGKPMYYTYDAGKWKKSISTTA